MTPPLSIPRRHAAAAAAALTAFVAVACGRPSEESQRAIADKIQKSLVDVEAIALEQKVSPEVVTEVQRNLTTIHEYQGEINGKLDSVTVNAIQAFQRTAGLEDDGIITEPTRQKLTAAAGQEGKG